MVSKTRRAKKTNGYRMAAPTSVEPGPYGPPNPSATVQIIRLKDPRKIG
jgi:hypothetical protein